MKTYELKPIYDARQSFYGKATVTEDKKGITLFSYNTPVCRIAGNDIYINNNVRMDILFSNTTLRHIKEFLKQHNFIAETKKQLITDYQLINF